MKGMEHRQFHQNQQNTQALKGKPLKLGLQLTLRPPAGTNEYQVYSQDQFAQQQQNTKTIDSNLPSQRKQAAAFSITQGSFGKQMKSPVNSQEGSLEGLFASKRKQNQSISNSMQSIVSKHQGSQQAQSNQNPLLQSQQQLSQQQPYSSSSISSHQNNLSQKKIISPNSLSTEKNGNNLPSNFYFPSNKKGNIVKRQQIMHQTHKIPFDDAGSGRKSSEPLGVMMGSIDSPKYGQMITNSMTVFSSSRSSMDTLLFDKKLKDKGQASINEKSVEDSITNDKLILELKRLKEINLIQQQKIELLEKQNKEFKQKLKQNDSSFQQFQLLQKQLSSPQDGHINKGTNLKLGNASCLLKMNADSECDFVEEQNNKNLQSDQHLSSFNIHSQRSVCGHNTINGCTSSKSNKSLKNNNQDMNQFDSNNQNQHGTFTSLDPHSVANYLRQNSKNKNGLINRKDSAPDSTLSQNNSFTNKLKENSLLNLNHGNTNNLQLGVNKIYARNSPSNLQIQKNKLQQIYSSSINEIASPFSPKRAAINFQEFHGGQHRQPSYLSSELYQDRSSIAQDVSLPFRNQITCDSTAISSKPKLISEPLAMQQALQSILQRVKKIIIQKNAPFKQL